MNKQAFARHQEHWRLSLLLYRDSNGKPLPATALRIGVALQTFEHSRGDKQCQVWPKRATLAKRAGIGGNAETVRREATRGLRALEEAGLIRKIREGVRSSFNCPTGLAPVWELIEPESMTEIVRGCYEFSTIERPEISDVTSDTRGQYAPEGSGQYTHPIPTDIPSDTHSDTHTERTVENEFPPQDRAKNIYDTDEPTDIDYFINKVELKARYRFSQDAKKLAEQEGMIFDYPAIRSTFIDWAREYSERRRSWETTMLSYMKCLYVNDCPGTCNFETDELDALRDSLTPHGVAKTAQPTIEEPPF